MVAEKLKSLLRIGAASTRFKDVFDIYYHTVESKLNDDVLEEALKAIIFDDLTMRENSIKDIYPRLIKVFNDRRFTSSLENAKNNWLQLPVSKVIEGILSFFENRG